MPFCGSCGAENRASSEFCLKCGRSLSLEPKPGMCVECGSMNALGLLECGNCGANITVPMQKRPDEAKPARKCKWCGNTVGDDEDICLECKNRRSDTKLMTRAAKKGKPSRRLVLGAILLMLTGLAAFGLGMMLMFLESLIIDLSGSGTGIGLCGVTFLLLGLSSLAGGILAISRRNYLLVLGGSVCSFLCVALFVYTMLGLLGAIIIGTPLAAIGPWLVYATEAEFD